MIRFSSAPSTPILQFPKPSPLTSRDPNTLPKSPILTTSCSKSPRPQLRPISRRSPQHPLTHENHQGESRARQRLLYLEKVRASSEEQRWLSRSNKIMRQQYVDQHRQWEQSLETVAAEMGQMIDEEEMELEHVDSISAGDSSRGRGISLHVDESVTGHDADLDRIVYEGDQETEALVSFYEQQRREDEELPQPSEIIENDDEDYDSLFWEVLKDKQGQEEPHHSPQAQGSELDHEMDLSLT